MDDKPFGIPAGTPVGDSVDRTVSSTPEPGSLIVLGIGLASMGALGWIKSRKPKVAAVSQLTCKNFLLSLSFVAFSKIRGRNGCAMNHTHRTERSFRPMIEAIDDLEFINKQVFKMPQFRVGNFVCVVAVLMLCSTADAGYIVIANDATKAGATSSSTAAGSAHTNLDSKTTSVTFQSEVIGFGNPTLGVTPGSTTAPSAAGGFLTSPNTNVYIVNTFNPSAPSTTWSFLTSGSAVGSASPGSLGNGAASGALSFGLNASTVGNKSGAVSIHRGSPYSVSGVKFPNAATGPNTDFNDKIQMQTTVFDHADASFNGTSQVSSITLDFGTQAVGSDTALGYSIFNNVTTAGFTAGLDLVSMVPASFSSPFSSDLSPYTGQSAGVSNDFTANFDPTAAGFYSQTYQLNFTDDHNLLGGSSHTMTLFLTLQGTAITAVPEPGSSVAFGMAMVGLLFACKFSVRAKSK